MLNRTNGLTIDNLFSDHSKAFCFYRSKDVEVFSSPMKQRLVVLNKSIPLGTTVIHFV